MHRGHRNLAGLEITHIDAAPVFADHRRLRPGEAPPRIDWKASARTDRLLIAEYRAEFSSGQWFDYAALTGLRRKARLSKLWHWVLEADRRGQIYGLRLLDRRIDPGCGAGQRRACLEALALW